MNKKEVEELFVDTTIDLQVEVTKTILRNFDVSENEKNKLCLTVETDCGMIGSVTVEDFLEEIKEGVFDYLKQLILKKEI